MTRARRGLFIASHLGEKKTGWTSYVLCPSEPPISVEALVLALFDREGLSSGGPPSDLSVREVARFYAGSWSVWQAADHPLESVLEEDLTRALEDLGKMLFVQEVSDEEKAWLLDLLVRAGMKAVRRAMAAGRIPPTLRRVADFDGVSAIFAVRLQVEDFLSVAAKHGILDAREPDPRPVKRRKCRAPGWQKLVNRVGAPG